ncbi:MAG: GNAT family N-acetyltransferase [Vicinamibacterales bacterium]
MMPVPSTIPAAAWGTTHPPLSTTQDCSVDVVTDYGAFLALERPWNDAVDRAAVAHPFVRHEWVRCWWDTFGAGATLHLLIVRVDDRIAAIAPLMRESVVMHGVPVRRIRFIQNDHTPRTDVIVASHPEESYRAIWNALHRACDTWDVLLFSQLERASPTCVALSALAAASGCRTGVWASSDSPFVTLSGTWDTYWNGLSAKFRSNLRNRLSRATRLGEIELEVLIDRDAIQAASADAWRLEASGWKQEAGTAIECDPAVLRFYSALIDRGTEAGWLHLLFLHVAGRRIATSYGACFRRRLFLFKTGYDPEYAACAPFKLLTYFAIRHACERGLTEVDFLGDTEPWKLEWTSTTRGHEWLFVFAGSMRARLLHALKFQWGPEVKRWRA